MSHDPSGESVFLYLTDTHAGGLPQGWHQQPRHDELLEPIMEAVGKIARDRGAELIVHGGDLTETAAASEMTRALNALAGAGLPTAFCLGNHDLLDRGAIARWRESKGSSAMADACVRLRFADVFILNNVWKVNGQLDWFWTWEGSSNPNEGLLPTQLQALDESLAERPDHPAVVAVHAPLEPLPPALTGAARPLHLVQTDCVKSLNAVLDRHPRVKLVLCGHNHVTSATRHDRPPRYHLTTSALTESPFDFRLIRIGPGSLRVETIASIPMNEDARYDPKKSWVNGRPADRTVELSWAAA